MSRKEWLDLIFKFSLVLILLAALLVYYENSQVNRYRYKTSSIGHYVFDTRSGKLYLFGTDKDSKISG